MWKITIKDLKVFFTDKKALFLTLLLPIGLTTLFAFAFGGAGGGDEEEGTPIVLLYADEDNSGASKELIASLDSIPGIEMESMLQEEAVSSIKNGDHIAYIILRKGLEDSLNNGNSLPAELQFDQSREMEIGVLQNLIISKLSAIKGQKDADHGVDRIMDNMFSELPPVMKDSIRNNIRSGMAEDKKGDTLIKMSGIVGEEAANWGLIQAVAGTAIMMLLFSVSAIGQSLLEEKESGVLKKLLQSPIRPYSILMGKMATATIISVFQLSVLFLFAWIAFGLDIFIDLPALLVMILSTAFACSAFGVLLASIVTSKKQSDSIGTIIILFMSAVGGSMIPIYIMPAFMQDAAVVSVNYWSIQGFYDIFWRGTGFPAILDNAGILFGITTGVLLVSAYFFKKNILRIT